MAKDIKRFIIQAFNKTKGFVKKPENFIKHYHLYVVFVFLISSVILFFHKRDQFTFALVIAAIGLLFPSLKYKLDQANYHKDLFEKRYEIYQAADKMIMGFLPKAEISKETLAAIDRDIFAKGYFLFDEETNKFLRKLYEAAVFIHIFGRKDRTKLKVKDQKQLEEYESYFANLVDPRNLVKEFKSMKIDQY